MQSDSKTIEIDAPPLPVATPASSDRSGRAASIDVAVDAPTASDDVAAEATQTSSDEVESGQWQALLIRLQTWLENRRVIAALVSLVVHLASLLILALVHYSNTLGLTNTPAATITIASEDDDSLLSRIPIQLAGESDPAPPQEQPAEELLSNPSANSTVDAQEVSRLLIVEKSEGPAKKSEAIQDRVHALNQNNLRASFSSTGVDGRRSENRRQVALQRGGTLASEKAVEAALEWLAAHQLPSGAWSLVHTKGECNGRCRHSGSQDRFDPAATGLSLLAFLGAGYTHREGKYQQNVARGIYFLRQIVEETPQGASYLGQSDRGMYNHGIATFAICEAYQLTGDPDLKRACQHAINFIVSSQSYQGGWGYLPKQPGDLTISGWQMMALKSASAAGLDVPTSTVLRAKAFVESQKAKDGVNYFYREAGEKSITCTSIGILMRMFLGDSWTDPSIIEGMKQIDRYDDYGNDIYFRYYATLTLFHAGGSFWERWNERCREHLIRTQATEGHEAGSWYFENPFGKEGGRLYTTAMAAMTLEVYYRYSPLYQQADQPFEL